MRHALLDGNKIVNIIEIDPRNVSDFPSAVTIPNGVGAGIGDTYEDDRFWRINPDTQAKEELISIDPISDLGRVAYDSAADCTSALLEISRLAQAQTDFLLQK